MTEGLRARKRRATARLIEQTAVQIAYDEGIDAVTVDRVCDGAMVSRSTFFNYFPSLEQAIFGAPLQYDSALTARILAEHGGDLVIAASFIVMESVRGARDDDVTRQRFALFSREPGVTNAVSWASHDSREGLVGVLRRWLDANPGMARLPETDHEAEARVAVSLSIALGDEVMRMVPSSDDQFPVPATAILEARERLARVAQTR
ncbi:TetR family transcriptional regulator [Demequina sp.]|uniref:TetR family transcriptional regulator n=1 Tax=Demequina sp. TaxID=2050685 RepID=UPI003A86FD61